jgi:hypothetical protein
MYGKMFPYAYSLFLKTFANDLLNIFDMQNHNYTGILEAHDVSKCLLITYNKSIQNKYFVIAHNCRTSFYYFIDNETNNPDVFLYNEELKYDSNYKLDNEYVLVNRPMGNFTDWLINKVICHIIMCKKDFVKIKETKHKLEQIIASTNCT